jgi:hypothetical protein
MGSGSFPEIKRPGRDLERPLFYSPSCKWVELYLYYRPLCLHGTLYSVLFLYFLAGIGFNSAYK